MKLFIVSKKMSTRLSSETQFYHDFEPLTNPQLIKKDPVVTICFGKGNKT